MGKSPETRPFTISYINAGYENGKSIVFCQICKAPLMNFVYQIIYCIAGTAEVCTCHLTSLWVRLKIRRVLAATVRAPPIWVA